MAGFWMREVAPTKLPGFDAFNRNQLLCRKASNHNRVRKVGHVSASRRVLRVLVVNDEQDSADGLARLVRPGGHAPRLAFDGLAALRVAAASPCLAAGAASGQQT